MYRISSWIKDSIKWRLEKMGYENPSQALNDAVNECLRKHTNQDYLTSTEIQSVRLLVVVQKISFKL